ncbi:hypothetical protein VTI74DRAFT_4813 [Chaetomium olivicolor]
MADNNLPSRRKTTIEIPLPSVRRYVPGSGPPPPRISLAPPRDSTAYIIDQLVLPPDKDMTETSRKLIYYHIGFTDLPAVQILVPCNKVLDYVSPRELEDWEYKNMEAKEEERAHLRAEKQRAGAAKRKPGRPPKVPMENMGASGLSSGDETLLLAQQVAGPSLSTPKKSRLRELVDSEDTGETANGDSDDAAIFRQLQEDAEAGDVDWEDQRADSESVDQLGPQDGAPVVDTHSRAGSAIPLLQDPATTLSAATPMKASIGSSTPAAPTVLGSSTSTPGKIRPAWAQAFGQPHSQQTAEVHKQNGHAKDNALAWSMLARPNQLKPSASAAPPAPAAEPSNHPKGSASQLLTPGAGARPDLGSNVSASKRKRQSTDGTNPTAERQQKRSHKKQQVVQEPEPVAYEWEVKELLDDQWVVEQGVKVHKYLVLWEGAWPPDQNPTWEPAENVQDQYLLQRYEKKKKAGFLKAPDKAQKTLHQYMAGRQYSSVAEAFEGGLDETGPVPANGGSDVDQPDETFLVTENVGDITTAGLKRTPSLATFDSTLARYTQSFSRG